MTPPSRSRTRPPAGDPSAPRPVGAPDDGDLNVVVLVGTLSSDPVERELPSGDVLVGYEVTSRCGESAPATSVPVVWFAPPTRRPRVGAGDRVVVIGHVRRRFFRAGGATASRTEVVATRVGRAGAAARTSAARVVADAARSLAGPGGG